jgi:maltose 6'-phosphate phosphatase
MNVLFGTQPGEPRLPPLEDRLQDMVDFIEDLYVEKGMPIHIIVFQELTNGLLAPFLGGLNTSVRVLRQKFLAKGLDYDTRQATESGLPGVFVTKNATFVLRPCRILFKLVKFLPIEERFNIGDILNIGDFEIPITRNVLMVRVKVPGHGKVDVYNTHLCASCSLAGRGQQVDAMLDFVENVEGFIQWFTFRRSPVVLGGDFNLDRFSGPESLDQYELITDDFMDAYAASQIDQLDALCDPDGEPFPDEHCTVGVTELDSEGPKQRIDYIFKSGFETMDEEFSRVVFNPQVDSGQLTISDHAGVFMSLKLPGF